MNAPFSAALVELGPSASDALHPLTEQRKVRKAVILAAGCGRRMGKLTAERPKGALEIGGHALIDWQIEALRAAGITDIAIVTGYAAEALAGRDVTYVHNSDWANGTQVETLLKAAEWINGEPVIVSYSDIIYHPCAVLALLERPGDIVIAYDADHRWLWKRRHGRWLKDSETFRVGPGQVLAEIGGRPSDIEVLDGQFMGLMLFTPVGLKLAVEHVNASSTEDRRRLDFTKLLGRLIAAEVMIGTAANLLEWMEIDGRKDLEIARSMAMGDNPSGLPPSLVFAADQGHLSAGAADDPLAIAQSMPEIGPLAPAASRTDERQTVGKGFDEIRRYSVEGAFAVQNWGRSGSTLLQSLFDDHSQVLSTPNFYSRSFYLAWATTISLLPEAKRIDAFLRLFRQWWDTGFVDAAAGLHRLGPERSNIAGVDRILLEGYLRAYFDDGRAVTRKNLFIAAHLAYALSRGQKIAPTNLRVLFPIHGEIRAVAAAFLEDFPQARFLHTIREPVANAASTLKHIRSNNLDAKREGFQSTLLTLFANVGERAGRRHTLYGDRAYFDWLYSQNQVLFLKLESLHDDPGRVVKMLADWIGIQDSECLTLSTWDGKKWWNRPEAFRDSELGNADLNRDVGIYFRKADKIRLTTIAAASPVVRSAYGLNNHGSARFSAVFSKVPYGSWPTHLKSAPSVLRSLMALRKLGPILPAKFALAIADRLPRERLRVKLMELNSGSITIRRRVPDADKSAILRAALILSPVGEAWRVRAVIALDRTAAFGSDRINAFFLDDALQPISASSSAFWLAVLSLGHAIDRVCATAQLATLTLALEQRSRQRLRDRSHHRTTYSYSII